MVVPVRCAKRRNCKDFRPATSGRLPTSMGTVYGMMPQNKLSQVTVYYKWRGLPQDDPGVLTDTDIGGVALNDNTQGLEVQLWTFTAVDNQVFVSAANTGGDTLLLTATAGKIEEVLGTFDQNMQPMVAYLVEAQWYYHWFDSVTHGFITSQLPVGTTSCRVAFDDRRKDQSPNSDILLFYTLNANLYFRMQRDRYQVDYLLRESVHATLLRADMSAINRMQLKMQAERL